MQIFQSSNPPVCFSIEKIFKKNSLLFIQMKKFKPLLRPIHTHCSRKLDPLSEVASAVSYFLATLLPKRILLNVSSIYRQLCTFQAVVLDT